MSLKVKIYQATLLWMKHEQNVCLLPLTLSLSAILRQGRRTYYSEYAFLKNRKILLHSCTSVTPRRLIWNNFLPGQFFDLEKRGVCRGPSNPCSTREGTTYCEKAIFSDFRKESVFPLLFLRA